MNKAPTNPSRNNQLRRQAVQMRLDGLALKQITGELGLSAPTIISAHKAYLTSGWSAVDAKPRGRQSGDSSILQPEQETLKNALRMTLPESIEPDSSLWSYALGREWLSRQNHNLSERAAIGYFQRWGLEAPFPPLILQKSTDQVETHWLENTYPEVLEQAKTSRSQVVWAGFGSSAEGGLFFAHTLRKTFYWLATDAAPTAGSCIDFFQRLHSQLDSHVTLVLKGLEIARVNEIQHWLGSNDDRLALVTPGADRPSPEAEKQAVNLASQKSPMPAPDNIPTMNTKAMNAHATNTQATDTGDHQPGNRPATLTHLQRLEAESIHIMREVVAEADNPVMLYSMGKDSAVMLHLANKAFFPAPPPFPLLHIDTGWKFRAMYRYRDEVSKNSGLELLIHTNPQGLEQGVNPFTHGSGIHTDIMKTEALKQALDKYRFDVALGGARRDEEKSRAKERIFSVRSNQQRWEPKNQRPECWQMYNARKHPGESIRVFPLSNWTELDIWQYIYQQGIPIVPLYYAAERPVVERDDALVMVDDERMPLHEGEVPMLRKVRFRTLGCYPLTGAVESTAATLPDIIQEMLLSGNSERRGRMIDHDAAASMEKKKQQGYF